MRKLSEINIGSNCRTILLVLNSEFIHILIMLLYIFLLIQYIFFN